MTPQNDPQPHEFGRELRPTQPSQERLTYDDLSEVKLNITADLGSCDMSVRDVLLLKKGSVLTLNKLAGEMADIQVNGVAMARGEVVVLGDVLHVRVAEILGMPERDNFSNE